MKRAWFESFYPGQEAEDWRKKVVRVVEDLVGSLAESGEPRAVIPSKIIRAAREALGGRPSRELVEVMVESVAAEDGAGPFPEPAFPGLLRDELDSSAWPWETPSGAESVMAVVERALEDLLRGPVPPYWAGCLEMGSRIVAVREFRAADPRRPGDRAAMLGRVMDFARESLGGNADAATWDGGPIDLDGCAPIPGLFRHLIRSLDLDDQVVVAAALAVIEAAARDELARDVPGEGPALWG